MSIKGKYLFGVLAEKKAAELNEIQNQLQSLILKRKIGYQDLTEYLTNPALFENLDEINKSQITTLLEAFKKANITNADHLNIILGEDFKIEGALLDINAVIDIDDDVWYGKKDDKKNKNG